MTAAGTHVVFGTGPAGRAVADALTSQGTHVRMVNRSGAPVLIGVASTVDWYRSHDTQVEFFPGLAEATALEVAA